MNFGAKRMIYFFEFFDLFFEKSGREAAGEKNMCFWFILDKKHKHDFYFLIYFLKNIFLKIGDLFFENHQNL